MSLRIVPDCMVSHHRRLWELHVQLQLYVTRQVCSVPEARFGTSTKCVQSV